MTLLVAGQVVRLHEFVIANVEPILVEWSAFARTQPSAAGLSRIALRDHTGQILRDTARELSGPAPDVEALTEPVRTTDARVAAAVARHDGAASAAETHGADRAMNGFTLREMVAEFRVLRAVVLRMWIASREALDADDLDDLMQFNAAIDRAVGESVSRFSHDLESAKDMFIAILTHDLRSPLQAVMLTARLLLETEVDREQQTAALQRIQRSTRRMGGMIEDLLDFTRTRIGSGLSVTLVESDVGQIAREAVDEARGAFPARSFEVRVEGNVIGQVDAERLKQVLANLLCNAADYGDPSTPVRVEVTAPNAAIGIAVINGGDLIPADQLAIIFDPFKRLQHEGDDVADSQHLGLGLYIAEQLVQAHGGRIEVTSTEADGTRFMVTLPR